MVAVCSERRDWLDWLCSLINPLIGKGLASLLPLGRFLSVISHKAVEITLAFRRKKLVQPSIPCLDIPTHPPPYSTLLFNSLISTAHTHQQHSTHKPTLATASQHPATTAWRTPMSAPIARACCSRLLAQAIGSPHHPLPTDPQPRAMTMPSHAPWPASQSSSNNNQLQQTPAWTRSWRLLCMNVKQANCCDPPESECAAGVAHCAPC